MGASKQNRKKSKFGKIPDWHLWSEVTRSISPLPRPTQTKNKALSTNKPLSEADQSQIRHQAALKGKKSALDIKTSWSPVAIPNHGAQYLGHFSGSPGIEPKIYKKVRKGQTPIDASIDLHGMHQNEARSALNRFIEMHRSIGNRTLLVITGKGLKKTGFGQIEQRGVLRHMLPIWLKEPGIAPMVSGIEVSARHHGGEGAFYVRLKRQKS